MLRCGAHGPLRTIHWVMSAVFVMSRDASGLHPAPERLRHRGETTLRAKRHRMRDFSQEGQRQLVSYRCSIGMLGAERLFADFQHAFEYGPVAHR